MVARVGGAKEVSMDVKQRHEELLWWMEMFSVNVSAQALIFYCLYYCKMLLLGETG